MNTFNTFQMEAITAAISSFTKAVCKRSAVFKKAVVIGVPNSPGCLMVSQQEEEDNNGFFPFLVSYFPAHEPKKVADDEVAFIHAYSEMFYKWDELISFIRLMCENDFASSAYDTFLLEKFK